MSVREMLTIYRLRQAVPVVRPLATNRQQLRELRALRLASRGLRRHWSVNGQEVLPPVPDRRRKDRPWRFFWGVRAWVACCSVVMESGKFSKVLDSEPLQE